MKKVFSLLLSGCMMLGMLAGCGSDAASSTTAASAAAPTEAAAAEATAAPETAETGSAADAAEATTSGDKTWVIATDTVFKPFEYTDESGNFVGIDVDIVAAIAEDQGFQYELKSLGWDAAIAACQAGQADGMIAGASITDERKESGWLFSDGYYTATQCMAVAGGQAVACFEDTPIMAASIKDGGLGLNIVEGSENDGADYGFAVFDSSKQELLDMFNAGLASIKANGKYDEIIAKYLG